MVKERKEYTETILKRMPEFIMLKIKKGFTHISSVDYLECFRQSEIRQAKQEVFEIANKLIPHDTCKDCGGKLICLEELKKRSEGNG